MIPVSSFFFSPIKKDKACYKDPQVPVSSLNNRKKMVGRWKMKWKHTWITWGASRLVGWHWQRLGDAWFPVSWSCALSMDLDFGLVCDTISYMPHILHVCVCVLHACVFLPPSFSKVCHIWVWIQKGEQPFRWVLDATKKETQTVFLRSWWLFCSEITVSLGWFCDIKSCRSSEPLCIFSFCVADVKTLLIQACNILHGELNHSGMVFPCKVVQKVTTIYDHS